jgi:hypothetical protein
MTVIFVTLLAICFCSYFIAGYHFSVLTFRQTPAIMSELDIIYYQDTTMDSMMSFVREDYFFNTSLITTDSTLNETGSQFFIDQN